MPIGGFNGSDPSPTLAQFQQYVDRAEDPLLHRSAAAACAADGGSRRLADRRLGGSDTSPPDGRRRHRLRPDRPLTRGTTRRCPPGTGWAARPGHALDGLAGALVRAFTGRPQQRHKSLKGARPTVEDMSISTLPAHVAARHPPATTRRCSTSWSRSTTRRSTSSRPYAGCTPTCRPASRTPFGSPSPTTPAPTRPRRSPPAGRRAARGPRRPPDGEGPRPGAASRPGRPPTRRCSPTWTSTCPPTSTRCCRWSRRCISGHSDLAIGTRLARGSRVVRGPEAGGHLPLLQPAAARRRCGAASPTPSAASRRSAPTSPRGCCRWSRTPAGSSTPSCSCSPSAPACASTRCRSTGSTTPTAASTSSATALADLRGHRPAGPGAGHRPAAAGGPARTARAHPAARGRRARRPARPAAALRRRRRRQHPRLPAAVRPAARTIGAQAANLVALLVTAVANTAPTGGSPSACAAPAACGGTRPRASSSSPRASA